MTTAADPVPPDEQTIPGPLPSPPTRHVEIAAQYLVDCVAKDMGLRNGRTAFYWHLIHVIQQQADASKREAE